MDGQREKRKILVFGDIMLDKYVIGNVNRISPEAPVAVVAENETRYVLGGAANVANNISALGGEVSLASLVGKDENGKQLTELLGANNIDETFLRCPDRYKTICKERIVAKNQQIVRVDYNDNQMTEEEQLKDVVDLCVKRVAAFDVVVISDYGKGVCTEFVCQNVIAACNGNNIPVIVDPKGVEWGKYKGATVITPNIKELSHYLNREVNNDDCCVENALLSAYSELGITNLLVTRSEKGMTCLDETGNILHLRSEAREVYDVSGAGDTVVAALAVFYNDDDLKKAIYMANVAAGITVGKFGTSVVKYNEVEQELQRKKNTNNKKIYGTDELVQLKEQVDYWRSIGETIVTTNGCFDILHAGHIKLLEEAKKLGTKLIVGLNSDDSVRRLKGANRPVNGEQDRAYLLAAIHWVDVIAIFDEYKQRADGIKDSDVPFTLIETINPDIHVKGGDYKLKQVPEAKYAKKFASVSFLEGHSTTMTIEKMRTGKE